MTEKTYLILHFYNFTSRLSLHIFLKTNTTI